MTTPAPRQSTINSRVAIALIVGSAAVVVTAISTTIAQQDPGTPPLNSASGATTTTTSPGIAPSTLQITFAKPTLTAPRYGKG